MNNLTQYQFDGLFKNLENYDAIHDKIELSACANQNVPIVLTGFEEGKDSGDKYSEVKLVLKFLEDNIDFLRHKDLSKLKGRLINAVDNNEKISVINQRILTIMMRTKYIGSLPKENQVAQHLQLQPKHVYSHIQQLDHKLLNYRSKAFANGKLLEVLDQGYQGKLGFVRCGAHALKNALVAIGMAVSQKIDSKWLTRTDVFEELLEFIYSTNPVLAPIRNDFKNADISIAHLQNAVDGLLNCDPIQFNSKPLEELREVCSNHPGMLSIFNIQDGKLNTIGNFAIYSMLNLYKASKNPDSFIHAFVLGNSETEHWFTLILLKEKGSPLRWIAADSLQSDNQIYVIQDIAEQLVQAMNDIDETLIEMYKNNIASAIAINLSRAEVNLLLDEKSAIDPFSIEILPKAFEFMQLVGCLNPQALALDSRLKKYATQLRDFAKLMSSDEPISLYCPTTSDEKAIFRNIVQEISLVLEWAPPQYPQDPLPKHNSVERHPEIPKDPPYLAPILSPCLAPIEPPHKPEKPVSLHSYIPYVPPVAQPIIKLVSQPHPLPKPIPQEVVQPLFQIQNDKQKGIKIDSEIGRLIGQLEILNMIVPDPNNANPVVMSRLKRVQEEALEILNSQREIIDQNLQLKNYAKQLRDLIKPLPQPIPQPVAQPIPQPVVQPLPQPVAQPLPQPIPQPVVQPLPEPMMHQQIHQPVVASQAGLELKDDGEGNFEFMRIDVQNTTFEYFLKLKQEFAILNEMKVMTRTLQEFKNIQDRKTLLGKELGRLKKVLY